MIKFFRKQLVLELKRLRLLPINVSNYDDPEVNLYSNCWPMIQGAIGKENLIIYIVFFPYLFFPITKKINFLKFFIKSLFITRLREDNE